MFFFFFFATFADFRCRRDFDLPALRYFRLSFDAFSVLSMLMMRDTRYVATIFLITA